MKQTTVRFKLTVLSLSVLGLSIVYAQPPSDTPPESSPTPSTSPSPSGTPAPSVAFATLTNTTLLNFLHHVNSAEISEANRALQRLVNEQARTYAQTMITDHQKSEQQISQLASQKGIVLYSFQRSTVDIANDVELGSLSGSDYDFAYLNLQLIEHQKALQDLTLLQSKVTDSDLQNLITQTIPVLQQHITLANSTITSVQAGGSSPTPSTSPTSSPTSSPSSSPTSSPSSSPSSSPTSGS